MTHVKLGEILVEKGLITLSQLKAAVAAQERQQGRIGEILVATGVIAEKEIVKVIGQQYHIPVATRENGLLNPNPDQLLHTIINYDFAKSYYVLPLRKENKALVVAVADPLDLLLVDNLRVLVRSDIQLCVATRSELMSAIHEFYTNMALQHVQRFPRRQPKTEEKQPEKIPEAPVDVPLAIPREEVAGAAKMFNIKLLREDPGAYKRKLQAKGADINLDRLLELDQVRRSISMSIDSLRSRKNAGDDDIKKLITKDKGPDVETRKREIISQMTRLAHEIDSIEPRLKEVEDKINDIVIRIPNLAHESVPVGSPKDNKTVREWGTPKTFDFKPKDHIEIAEALDIIDFKRAAKISGSNFILYKNEGARLERALMNFMLDLHTREHGYREIFPPFLVNTASMTGTGQLPKMQEDMYALKDDGLYLIPTAEVPVTNIHRQEMIAEDDLPLCYAATSACFRREAGSYGKDTRGLVRVHQFDKVEMVKFVMPETSYDELEKLVANAEKVLQLLGLPYRVVLLASLDLSFASSKCYDLEAHAGGIGKWLEVSSCSNFEDFQARRANIRFKRRETKKPEFVHTLNGSGLALPRTMVAILENYQTSDGEVTIPDVLRPYMGGMEKIGRR